MNLIDMKCRSHEFEVDFNMLVLRTLVSGITAQESSPISKVDC